MKKNERNVNNFWFKTFPGLPWSFLVKKSVVRNFLFFPPSFSCENLVTRSWVLKLRSVLLSLISRSTVPQKLIRQEMFALVCRHNLIRRQFVSLSLPFSHFIPSLVNISSFVFVPCFVKRVRFIVMLTVMFCRVKRPKGVSVKLNDLIPKSICCAASSLIQNDVTDVCDVSPVWQLSTYLINWILKNLNCFAARQWDKRWCDFILKSFFWFLLKSYVEGLSV